MYNVLNRKTVSDFIFQDEIYRGFSIHSPKGVALWEMLLNCLLECFDEELGDIKIIRCVPQIIRSDFLSDFYEDHFYRIENRIPCMKTDEGHPLFMTTDELPYLFSNLDKGNTLFSTYTVVRPRSFAVKPYLREEFIRYFQFLVSADVNELDDTIERVKNASVRFFERIRIPVVLVDRHSDSYYFKKSCFHSVWLNGNIESVLQCGILRKKTDASSGKGRAVIDVGGAQRLLASFIYANSDSYGLFLPYYLRDYDVIIRGGTQTKLTDTLTKSLRGIGGRIEFSPDSFQLKEIKRIAIEESAIAIAVPRKADGKEFLTIYNRDMTKSDLYSDHDVTEWITQKYKALEQLTYDKQTSMIRSRIRGEKLYFKNSHKSYTIVREGLFNESAVL